MEITLREVKNSLVIALAGEVSLDNSYEFEEILSSKIDSGTSKIILNLQKVSHLDSATIGMIIASWIKANSKGYHIRLCGINPDIQEIFSISKIDKIISIDASEDR